MSIPNHSRPHNSRLYGPVLITALFLAVASSLTVSSQLLAAKLPEEQFTIARMAIEEAQEVDADASAGSEMMQAEEKFQLAVEHNDKGDEEMARRLLQQSMLHAELAEVEGLQGQADIAFDELNAAMTSLKIELGRP